MKIRFSAHGAYHHQYHVVWIPKYRRKVLKGEVKQVLEKRLFDIQESHPEVEIEKFSIQIDHVHLVSVIPPKYSVSSVIGKIKANTSRQIRNEFPWVKKMYWRSEFWSPASSHRRWASTKRSSRDMLSFRRKWIQAKCSWISGLIWVSHFKCHGRKPVGIYYRYS